LGIFLAVYFPKDIFEAPTSIGSQNGIE